MLSDSERAEMQAKADAINQSVAETHNKLLDRAMNDPTICLRVASKLMRDMEEMGRSLPHGVLCYYCQRYCSDVGNDGYRLPECEVGPFGSCNFLWQGFADQELAAVDYKVKPDGSIDYLVNIGLQAQVTPGEGADGEPTSNQEMKQFKISMGLALAELAEKLIKSTEVDSQDGEGSQEEGGGS